MRVGEYTGCYARGPVGRKAPPLTIETVLAVRTLESGRVTAQPLSRLRFGAYGQESEALLQAELFAGEFLRRSDASTKAAFSLPDERIELLYVEVELPSARAAVGAPLSFAMPCAVLPHRRSRWVIVLPLGLTVHVGRGEDLHEVVGLEAKRFVAAAEPSSWERLGYFGARGDRLERVTLSIARGASAPAGGAKALRKKVDRAVRARHALKVLESVAHEVRLPDTRGPEPVGFAEPLRLLAALLSGKERRSVLLVGGPRVGKTTLVLKWRRDHPDRWLFRTSGAQLVAGMSGLGQWQERVRRVMEAAEELDAVLFFDDLRDLFGEESGALDLASAIRPWLEEGRVRVVGELTPESADLFASRQAGFFSAMHPLRVEAQDTRSAREALRRGIAHAETHEPDRPRLAASAIDTVVELTERFLPYRPFPGKAVRLVDELRSSAERAQLVDRRQIEVEDVYTLFSIQTGIPAFLLRDDVAWRVDRARELFVRRIVGQREAVDRIIGTLAVVKAGLAPGDKPLASFLFAGPTGVGKTALTRALAELLFGSTERLVRFDMSELADPGAAERLLRGSADGEGLLTSAIRQQPFCVVLLDEIEKAHPSVFDLLLAVLGEGRLTDARGRTAFFHNAIIVMTSNLGTRHRSRRVGIDPPEEAPAARFEAAVEEHFRPEFVNRIDRVVPFASLSSEEIREVCDLAVDGIALRRGFGELGVSLDVTEAALDRLAEEGFEEAYGARALRRRLEDGLVAPVARALGPLGQRARGARVRVRSQEDAAASGRLESSLGAGALVVEVLPGDLRVQGEELRGLERVAALRRTLREQLELPTVEELRERRDYLLAELSYGKSPPEDVGSMQATLHALNERFEALDASLEEMESLEELVLVAALAGERAGDLGAEAREVRLTFEEHLFDLFLFAESRHQATLLVQEWDAHRPLDSWLRGLLGALPDLEWTLSWHLHRDPDTPASWPPLREWGPARDADALAAHLERRDDKPMSALLCVRGPHAGYVMALECGVHRHHRPRPRVEESVFALRMLSSTRGSLEEADLDNRRARPRPVPNSMERRLIPAARDVHDEEVAVSESARVPVRRGEYWPRIRAIALAHLLLLEERLEDRELLFAAPLDREDEDEEAEEAGLS